MATVPKRVSERLSKETKKFQRILKAAKDRDINESDTVVIVTDMLSNLFGFDKYTEVTSEYAIKGTFCDLAVQVGDSVKYLIEVKAIGLDLKDAHTRQAVSYGSQHGIQWVVLTNGVDWEIYCIKFERPVSHELLCSFNILDMNSRKSEDQEMLFLLCKEGLAKDVISEYHKHVKSVNRFIIGAILQTDPALNTLRRELRKVSPGLRVDLDEIRAIITEEVLKREILTGDMPDDAKARVKKANRTPPKKRKAKPKTPAA
jgi:hypothetical protein